MKKNNTTSEINGVKRTGFVFYEGFLFAGQSMSKKKRMLLYESIINYGIEGLLTERLERELDACMEVKRLFIAFKPQLDANNRKYLNGLKGKEHGAKGGKYGHLGERPTRESNEELIESELKKIDELFVNERDEF